MCQALTVSLVHGTNRDKKLRIWSILVSLSLIVYTSIFSLAKSPTYFRRKFPWLLLVCKIPRSLNWNRSFTDVTNWNMIKFIPMGAKAWTFILGLKPYLLMGMCPRRSKWLERPQSEWPCKERVEGISPRGSSSSDLTNVNQVGIRLTCVTFQEIPAMKIDFRCVRRW